MILSEQYTKCPKCGEEDCYRTFKPNKGESYSYGEYVGYCEKCGHLLTPVEFKSKRKQCIYKFSGRSQTEQTINNAGNEKVDKNDKLYYVSRNYAHGCNENSHLYQALSKIFGPSKVSDAFHKYGVETCIWKYREYATIFWYIDSDGTRLAYRIMQYEEDSHSIKKETITQSLNIDGHNQYCLFGCHLLNLPNSIEKKIILVESEKTALIGSIAYPEAIWMATGSSYYLNPMNIKDINHERIILCPDPDLRIHNDESDELHDWYNLIEEVQPQWLEGVRLSYFMEEYDKRNGKGLQYDIGDYIVDNYGNLAPFEEIIK